MAEHRRRARRNQAIEPQQELKPITSAAPQQEPQVLPSASDSEQPAAPRRRRRAQPPREITQKIPRVSAPEDAPIPRLPAIEEPAEEKKRYKKAKTPLTTKPKTEKNQEAAKLRREKAHKALRAGAAAGTSAAKTAGGVLLLLAMLLMEGGKKLAELLTLLFEQIKKKIEQRSAAGGQEEAQEIVLEAIRPQEYHGRGAQHAAQPEKKQKAAALLRLSPAQTQRLISAVLVLVAAVSLWQIGSILLRTFRTTRLNAQLSERYASMGGNEQTDETAFVVYEEEETPAPTQTPVPETTMEPEAAADPETRAAPAATPAPELVKTTKFHQVGGNALPEMEALYNENRDLVAWINIPDVIDLPVVYRDNDYYLKRDFYKQKNTAGTIFLDKNHPFKEKSQNLLLHGHNMKDGTMFGRLTQYIYDRTYIKNHPFINLSTLWRKEQYVIFAILDVSLNPSDETFFNYFTHNTFSSDAEFTSYIRQLQLRSMVAIPIDVNPSDALLTLSTCLEENRLVIVARRLRDKETRAELRQRIHTSTRQ